MKPYAYHALAFLISGLIPWILIAASLHFYFLLFYSAPLYLLWHNYLFFYSWKTILFSFPIILFLKDFSEQYKFAAFVFLFICSYLMFMRIVALGFYSLHLLQDPYLHFIAFFHLLSTYLLYFKCFKIGFFRNVLNSMPRFSDQKLLGVNAYVIVCFIAVYVFLMYVLRFFLVELNVPIEAKVRDALDLFIHEVPTVFASLMCLYLYKKREESLPDNKNLLRLIVICAACVVLYRVWITIYYGWGRFFPSEDPKDFDHRLPPFSWEELVFNAYFLLKQFFILTITMTLVIKLQLFNRFNIEAK